MVCFELYSRLVPLIKIIVNAIVIIYFRNFGEIMRFVSIVASLLTFVSFSNGEIEKTNTQTHN